MDEHSQEQDEKYGASLSDVALSPATGMHNTKKLNTTTAATEGKGDTNEGNVLEKEIEEMTR